MPTSSEPSVAGPSAAELSAIAAQIDELTKRVGNGAMALDQSPTEAVAAALFDVERQLRGAKRAMARAVRS